MRSEFIEITADEKEAQQKAVQSITRGIAIALAFVSVFIFFFKLLFF